MPLVLRVAFAVPVMVVVLIVGTLGLAVRAVELVVEFFQERK